MIIRSDFIIEFKLPKEQALAEAYEKSLDAKNIKYRVTKCGNFIVFVYKSYRELDLDNIK